MARSKQPTWVQLRAVAELLGDMALAPRSPGTRERLFLSRCQEIFGARASMLFQGGIPSDPDQGLRFLSMHDYGIDEGDRANLLTYLAENGQDDPTIPSTQEARALPTNGVVLPRLREEILSDQTFYGTQHYGDLCRSIDFDDRLCVTTRLSNSVVLNLALHRAVGDRRFSQRERTLAGVLAEQAFRLIVWSPVAYGGAQRTRSTGGVVDLADLREDASFNERCERFALTNRERDVALWVSRGLSNKEIGWELGISPETVKIHLGSAFRKTGITNRVLLAQAFAPPLP